MNSNKIKAAMRNYIYEHFNKDLSYTEIDNLYFKLFYSGNVESKETRKILESTSLFKNYESFRAFFDYLRKMCSVYGFGIDQNDITICEINFTVEYFNNNLELKDKISIFSKFNSLLNRYVMPSLEKNYTKLFTEEEQHSLEVIEKLLDCNPHFMTLLFSYIKESDKLSMLDKYPEAIYRYAYPLLTKEDKEYLFPKIKKENKIYMHRNIEQYTAFETVALRNKSILPKKLKEMYGKSYTEKTGLSIDDEDTFIYTLLNSNVLNSIFSNPAFNNDDIIAINTILNIFEDRKKDVANIRKRIEEIKKKTSIEENTMCNYILANKDNEVKLDEFLTKNNITKDNFFNYIKGRKFLDKKLKEALLLILSKHFKTDYISVYDIIDMIEESKERGVSFDDVLRERNIDKKLFNDALNRLKKEKPTIYNLIYESMNSDFSINKKMIKLYHSIISSKIKDYDIFVSRYKKTPEQVLEMFEDTPLFDELYDSMLKWYDFKNGLPEEKNKKEI